MPDLPEETEPRPWTWPWLIATTLSKAAVAVLVCLALWGALPAVIGWHPTTVSSGSMLPRLHVGDVAVSRPLGATPPTLDSVLLFDDPDHPGRLRLHRFVRVDDDGLLVTRGDANTSDDSSPVSLTAVRGIGTLRVPWVGLPVIWLRERAWLALALAVIVLLGLTALAGRGRSFGFREPAEDEDEDAGPPPPAPPRLLGGGPEGSASDVLVVDRSSGQSPRVGGATSRTRPGLRNPRRLAVLGAAVVLGLVTAAPAEAAFSGTTTSPNGLAAASYFSCANAVTAGSPYLWYRLDETSSVTTTATDSSGGARNGSYGQQGKTAGATRACPRDSGRAMTFDGSSGYLSSPLIAGGPPNTFTIAVWFKTTTNRGGKLIGVGSAQTGVSSNYDRHLYLTNAGTVVFGVYPGSVKTLTSTATYNDGAWHQAVATLSSAGMRLYVDGKLLGSNAGVTTAEGYTTGYLRVGFDNLDGWDSTPSSRYLAGTLDDAALYLTALTPAQVSDQYEAGTS